ncbi:YPR013C-like protein [Saccharomyces cerevisiae x Saccharomyces kudriavzevii VIN7]|uniref:YPR013C-like protein n=1 Tax=Saccharomyces cerevisiae x Saccharomyces kudriavzevii (strain VIN7) TaxID=1095631 RepID=H0H2A6_SACCK|nr:YPR013C-like protein [Saccharomyces cerevisiae x Saccharomyces kudriavzevii VIN7]
MNFSLSRQTSEKQVSYTDNSRSPNSGMCTINYKSNLPLQVRTVDQLNSGSNNQLYGRSGYRNEQECYNSTKINLPPISSLLPDFENGSPANVDSRLQFPPQQVYQSMNVVPIVNEVYTPISMNVTPDQYPIYYADSQQPMPHSQPAHLTSSAPLMMPVMVPTIYKPLGPYDKEPMTVTSEPNFAAMSITGPPNTTIKVCQDRSKSVPPKFSIISSVQESDNGRTKSEPGSSLNSSAAFSDWKNGNRISSTKLRKQCPVCGKICSRPSTLKTHYLIHTGDTPFKCTWEGCSKSFNVKSNMLRHLKSHERKRNKVLNTT